MSRYVRIATAAFPLCRTEYCENIEFLTETMKKYIDSKTELLFAGKPDLLIMPEVCDEYAGFSSEQHIFYYENKKEIMIDFFREKAKKYHCNIAYPTMIIKEDSTFRNVVFMIDRQGTVKGIYHKNYCVIHEGSPIKTLCGKNEVCVDLDIGRVGFALCFDLNFEELLRRYKKHCPEIMIFPSMYNGGLMKAYWAYSLRCFFASAVAGLESPLISPVGEVVSKTTNYFDSSICNINLDYKVIHLDGNWEKINKAKLKYGDKISVCDPGYLGAVMISSESEKFSADDIINEFEMELLDDYLKRSENYRQHMVEK